MNFNLDKLNEAQRIAVTVKSGPILVTAGAGTGKTNLLTHRVAYLINEGICLPENILAITFTNKATNEMKERILAMCGTEGKWVTVSTFHSFCVKVLREYIEKLGENYNRYFTIYDDSDKKKAIKLICDKESGFDTDFQKNLAARISGAKNDGILASEYVKLNKGVINKQYAEFYIKYEEYLANNNALDFDDLILKTIVLFNRCPDVLFALQNRYKYIHIDEFQDTNKPQFDLACMLAARHRNILIVGDEDQSIYGWRGARYDNIFNFKTEFNECIVVKLEENYRSTKNILDIANKLISKNTERFEKVLYTSLSEGDEVLYKQFDSDYLEADYVASKVHNLIKQHVVPKEIAVLFRINSISLPFENAFNKLGIAYKIVGGFKFFERAEIKAIFYYFKALINEQDNVAAAEILSFPKKGIGDKTVEKLENEARGQDKSLLKYVLSLDDNYSQKKVVEFKEFLKNLIENINGLNLIDAAKAIVASLNLKENVYNNRTEEDENRLLNVKSLLNNINTYYENNQSASLADYVQSVSLDNTINEEDKDEQVILATVHGVKGLEFENVFVVALEEGLFPFSKSVDEGNIEEERRLMYVAATRAKTNLTLSSSRNRYSFKAGFNSFSKPSMFLKEMGIHAPESAVPRYKELDFDEGRTYEWDYKTRQRKPVEGFDRRRYQQHSYNYLEAKPKIKHSIEKVDIHSPNEFIKNLQTASSMQKTENLAAKIKPGSFVSHFRFGQGKVLEMTSETNAKIEFEGNVVKELNLQFAPIELIKE